MKLTFEKITKRLTGISIPVFGVSWNPSEPDRDVAKKIVFYLEDRRALFHPYDTEVPYHVIESVMQIREYLTDLLQKIETDSELVSNIRVMRAACRKYLDENLNSDKRRRHFGPVDVISLGELRGVFGRNLAEICVKYGISIDSDLSDILPFEDID